MKIKNINNYSSTHDRNGQRFLINIYRPLISLYNQAFYILLCNFELRILDLNKHLTVRLIYLEHLIMPRQLYQGEYKFYTIGDNARQAKQRADTQMRIAKLRERHLKEQNNNNIIAEQIGELIQVKLRAET